MDNIIVYVDDAAYALQTLQSMQPSDSGHNPARWILVGCAPRVTHRASKWVTNSARESWRGKWADKVFASLLPMLQQNGDIVITVLAQSTLRAQTEVLLQEYGAARVIDARRPKVAAEIQGSDAAPPVWNGKRAGLIGCTAALLCTGLLLGSDMS